GVVARHSVQRAGEGDAAGAADISGDGAPLIDGRKRQGVAVQVDRAGQQVRTGVTVVDGLVAREAERQADHGAAREGLIPESQTGGQRDGVARQLVTNGVDGDGVKRGTGGEVV